MADLFDGRDLAGLKAPILAKEQDKQTSDKPVTQKQRIIAGIAIILIVSVLIGIYVVAFALH